MSLIKPEERLWEQKDKTMIRVTMHGNFTKTNSFFQRILEKIKVSSLDEWGRRGVEALSSATPVDTGKTADSWYYEIVRDKEGVKVQWMNSNVNSGVNIALIIQYGHASRNGVFIEGRDYINPALKPIFDGIEESAWKEVKEA